MEKKLSSPKKSKGQVLVMYAIMLLVLVAIMGLAIDVGYAYVSYARLRRAVDAAALNASNQIKENYTADQLEDSAREFLLLNDVNDPHVEVKSCKSDFAMCTDPPRKLVSVKASSNVPTFFMSVLGFNSLQISASAESEAATVDVILVIDVSESMSNNYYPDGFVGPRPMADPYLCNHIDGSDGIPGECQSFEQVKASALDFVDQLFPGYDRVGIVTFDRMPHEILPLSLDLEMVKDEIRGLQVFEAEPCLYLGGETVVIGPLDSICRVYDIGSPNFRANDATNPTNWPKAPTESDIDDWPFIGMECSARVMGETDRIPHCYSTNVGGGLAVAGDLLARKPGSRDESLWVVIVLGDGAANVAINGAGQYLCPNPDPYFCRDGNPATRHDPDDLLHYDPDDYARDMADYLYNMEVYTFSIGLGGLVETTPEAGALLNYVVRDRGIYYPAPNDEDLRAIFLQIANNIATRITR